ncbi:pyocin knob domain-containing protein [Paenibacillus sp. DMB5]|uniref:pyocin knob domain-containing protein n=1 Tax=Paenibacillus sp. DMB5 TaxID=1780103 RepID=UPI00076DA97E|nr:pyocin knob domain-containing protein [Paenibacillus sp. DMB5]KUP25894.1 hypothetical protein AWJ19_33290 [Paenibacillus sp. DMB5]
MKTTGNLGLKKPDGTDIVDIADINGNMDILDTAVKGAQDHAADTVKHITAAERTAWNAKASTVAATASAAGLMAAADKAKLDGVAAGANNYTHPNHTGDVTSTSDGVTAIAAGVIVDADVNSAAAIGWGKISKTGSSLADLATRSAGDLSSGTLAAARLPAISGDITMAAGAGTAVITAGAIVNADVNASAAIDASKIGTGVVSNAEFAYLDGVTSAIQTQLNAKETPAGAQTKANTAESNAKVYTDAKAWQKYRLTGDDGKSLVISGTDLNNITANGFYNGDTLSNSPDGTASWFYIEVQCHSNGSGYVLQKAHRLNGGVNSFFMRTKENNVWGAWSADLFQSVANGKSSIASAISGKGVAASGSDDFGTLAAKISRIVVSTGGEYVFNMSQSVTTRTKKDIFTTPNGTKTFKSVVNQPNHNNYNSISLFNITLFSWGLHSLYIRDSNGSTVYCFQKNDTQVLTSITGIWFDKANRRLWYYAQSTNSSGGNSENWYLISDGYTIPANINLEAPWTLGVDVDAGIRIDVSGGIFCY